ncbi:MAG: glycosyltransferase [Thiobacillus sp.]|uniref:glycosyltransferase n=1 Tax=Thiobacillus sp. TaxID=924 RepID=UPI002735E64E|nr:glycosyltransferase [Thiobacillus sp.]MDP3584914.1 glycosyltransferase [Thiobacillus sp.]
MGIEKKNNAVVFGLTADHVFAVACVMMDIRRLSPGLVDEVVIIHDGIREKDRKLLGTILPTRFIHYDFPLKSCRVLDARAVRQFTKMVFTKFECLRLLDDYKNVMWSDYDIVIKSDISELFSTCVPGIKMVPGGLPVRGQLHEAVDEYDMDVEGVSAGIFVFQDNLKNYKEMHQFCYAKLEKYAEILYMPEQAIFDFMLQEYRLQPDTIDVKVYSPHPTDPVHAEHAKIIHAYGQPKFWNGLQNDQWDSNYKAWLRMGGSRYRPLTVIDRLLRKAKRLSHRMGMGT